MWWFARNKTMSLKTYDETYEQSQHVFGTEAEPILKNFVHKINKTSPVLDIGIGQGRNSFFLAKEGFSVEGIDPSGVAVETVLNAAKKDGYDFRAYQSGYENFVPEKLPYSAILVFGLIQILNWDSIRLLTTKLDQWTQKGSLIFVTAFSKKDVSYGKYSREWEPAGKYSFTDGEGNYRTFLEENEILDLFPDHRVVYHWEGTGPVHRHGKGPEEQHKMIELVVEKM